MFHDSYEIRNYSLVCLMILVCDVGNYRLICFMIRVMLGPSS